ncbi:hypothetical protein GCM10023324_28900 [Streptomyces youssoufiensis]
MITSSVTLVEARDPKVNQARFDYAVSRVNIVPPTEAIARHASKLLAAAGLHGHTYALDAIVAVTALAAPAPVTVLTSDPEDLRVRCRPDVRVVKVCPCRAADGVRGLVRSGSWSRCSRPRRGRPSRRSWWCRRR